ncbi:Aspartyl/glutamyl-tRNA (Asn/Gln) amidotransferase subunit B [Rhynchospora pubera]|uniref:Aspartyl/glutamyl-tRNA (Asn/Gln) amidotransferase subunit B n=1 Tax=Rhynchospora pubera TaxID=906938 RepID=A0AAV8DN98_9POAL|nr:Aspartyl/glutamyl-tRNA (Asn/Gln) amidotransferase subunit B [Rhynchospora pubera]KAJ4796958.1 Aspartyl/glutamyl-tRNA (Asn/Gln) amidotransferase subunit B [Rhynchospora pubera]KAJ4820744.1 Aspartyl/glutamyl-tRNA (Asn/Gln) amidotransferase subunit B [Rhynchospora pubera]
MMQDQVLHKCNTSKNKKPKKEPQRGLGVAQLERLRLEEQRKANALSSSSSSSAISYHNSFPGLQLLPSPSPPVPQTFLQQASPSTAWTCHNFSNWRHQLSLPQASVPLMSSGYVPWLEPPSNQIFSSDSKSTLVLLGDNSEITGIKRPLPLPFNLDSFANPFSNKIPNVSSLFKVHGSLPYGNDSFGCGSKTATFSGSSKQMQREHTETCDGDFLTLGITSSLPCSKQLPVEWTPLTHLYRESNDVADTVSNGEVGRKESQTFYIFLPMGPTSYEKPSQEQMPEVPDDLDLNLRL